MCCSRWAEGQGLPGCQNGTLGVWRGGAPVCLLYDDPVPRCCMTILTESQAQWLPTPAYLLRLNMPVSCWLSMLSSCCICLAGPCLSSLCSICIICIICICLAVSAVSCCIYLAVPCLASICIRQKGHSCKIGNMHVPGTSENQNRQFHEIHHFCLIFTFEYYIVAQKHIRQS